MNDTVQIIPLSRLALAFVPVCAVLLIIHRWSLGTRAGLIAVGRMVTQLLLVGYVLTFIFESNSAAVVLSVASVMLAAAGWIALRPLGDERRTLYPRVLVSISVGAVTVVVIATQGVLDLGVWHDASVVIPLAGIVFANSMNTVSLAAERFRAERRRGAGYPRRAAHRDEHGVDSDDELPARRGDRLAPWHDDRSDPVRCDTAHRRPVSDSGHVHDLRVGRTGNQLLSCAATRQGCHGVVAGCGKTPARVGFGAKPRPDQARTCAPRRRGVGRWGPRERRRGVRGEAPSR